MSRQEQRNRQPAAEDSAYRAHSARTLMRCIRSSRRARHTTAWSRGLPASKGAKNWRPAFTTHNNEPPLCAASRPTAPPLNIRKRQNRTDPMLLHLRCRARHRNGRQLPPLPPQTAACRRRAPARHPKEERSQQQPACTPPPAAVNAPPARTSCPPAAQRPRLPLGAPRSPEKVCPAGDRGGPALP